MKKTILLTLMIVFLGFTSLYSAECYGPIARLNNGDNVEVALKYNGKNGAHTDFIGTVVDIDLKNCVLTFKSKDLGTLLIDGNSILFVVYI